MIEIWKDIQDYIGLYQVSNQGNVRSVERRVHRNGNTTKICRQHLLRPQRQVNGYLFVSLSKDGRVKQYLIHRLVAKAFIPGGGEVNHIDENKENNCAANLEWVSHKYNANYGTAIERRTKNSDFSGSNNPMFGRKGKNNPHSKPVKQFDTDGNYIQEYESVKIAGQKTNTNPSGISGCAKGRLRTCGGFVWKYSK